MAMFDSISTVFGRRKIIQTLAMRGGLGGEAKTLKSEEEVLQRVSSIDLERIYIREGMVYNWINKIVESFIACDFRVNTNNTRERKIMEDFLRNSDFKNLLKTTVQHLMVYGNAFWEMITNDGPKILAVGWIDPKSMDVRRGSSGKIIYDRDGKPQSYVQYVKWDVNISQVPEDRRVDQTPMFTWQSGRGILLKREEIVHFTLNTVGDSWWGVGLIEPIYNTVRVKQNAESGYAEAVQRVAYPRVWVQVGDESHPPTQEQIDDVWTQLKDLETKHQFVSPYYYNPRILESKRVEKLAQNLKYFSDQIVAGLGGPKPFITGLGTDTNKATLSDQKILFFRSLRALQEEISEDIMKNIFAIVAKQNKFHSVPSLVWEEISTESLDSKAERLIKYVSSGLLKADKEIRNIIRRAERLPEESTEKPKEEENES